MTGGGLVFSVAQARKEYTHVVIKQGVFRR